MQSQLPTLFIEELAKLLGKTRDSVYTALCRNPESLPPPLYIPGRSTLIWLREDVLEWLKAHRATTIDRETKSNRGAPTKRERMEATQRGMSVSEMRQGNRRAGVQKMGNA